MPTAVYHPLKLEKDVRIPLRDGAYVVADVFRPDAAGRFPAIITMGPYSKDIHFRDWNPTIDYERLPERGPYMHWETVNPEWWVPQGIIEDTTKDPLQRKLNRAETKALLDNYELANP